LNLPITRAGRKNDDLAPGESSDGVLDQLVSAAAVQQDDVVPAPVMTEIPCGRAAGRIELVACTITSADKVPRVCAALDRLDGNRPWTVRLDLKFHVAAADRTLSRIVTDRVDEEFLARANEALHDEVP